MFYSQVRELQRSPGHEGLYNKVLFEFNLIDLIDLKHESAIRTNTVFSAAAQTMLKPYKDISLATEIIGRINEYAHCIFIITRADGTKLWYYKYRNVPLDTDWWTSKNRDALAKDVYVLTNITDIHSPPPKNLYPEGWPEDLIDPLAITV
jgi:hypothetical protein